MLKHASASDAAIKAASNFKCAICESRKGPKLVRPISVPTHVEPFRVLQMDVKCLPSWIKEEKIACLNIVCEGSSLQQMGPFFVNESSAVLRDTYRNIWSRPYGRRARVVKFDAARTNLGQLFVDQLEQDGAKVLDAAGQVHEDVGKAEVHGRWIEEIFTRMLDELQPTTKEQWVDCLDAALEG